MTDAIPPRDDAHRELLCLHVGDQDYAIDIMSVREIRGWSKPTALPHAAVHVRGVINLRGTILTIIDLAARLGVPSGAHGARNVIIVVERAKGDVGLLVNAVSDILTLPCDALQPPPSPVTGTRAAPIGALAVRDGRMIQVLDLEAIVPESGGVAA